MSGSSTKASARLRAARVGLSLRGVSAGDSPRRTPRTHSLCSYPRDKACNETTRASRQLVWTDARACPGRSMAETRTVGSPRERRVWVCPVPSRCSRDGQARALPSRPMRDEDRDAQGEAGLGCVHRGPDPGPPLHSTGVEAAPPSGSAKQQLRATLTPQESRVLEGRSNQTEAALRHPGARRHPPPTNLSPQDQAWVCGPSESTGAAAPQAGTHHRW